MSPSREGGGGEISGGIWARERGNTAHIPGGQMMVKRRGLRFFETIRPGSGGLS